MAAVIHAEYCQRALRGCAEHLGEEVDAGEPNPPCDEQRAFPAVGVEAVAQRPQEPQRVARSNHRQVQGAASDSFEKKRYKGRLVLGPG